VLAWRVAGTIFMRVAGEREATRLLPARLAQSPRSSPLTTNDDGERSSDVETPVANSEIDGDGNYTYKRRETPKVSLHIKIARAVFPSSSPSTP
jgi:hypothetical protein